MKNELQSAISDINQSIANDPANAWAYRNKGIYYLKVGDHISAVRLMEQALRMDDTVDDLFYWLAEAYAKAGDLTKACEAVRESLKRKEAQIVFSFSCK
jgi:tetratricopeptide (TPR) repeat protein